MQTLADIPVHVWVETTDGTLWCRDTFGTVLGMMPDNRNVWATQLRTTEVIVAQVVGKITRVEFEG